MRTTKNLTGGCPECGASSTTIGESLHPTKKPQTCDICSANSMRHANGSSYPLVDPTDARSQPVISAPR